MTRLSALRALVGKEVASFRRDRQQFMGLLILVLFLGFFVLQWALVLRRQAASPQFPVFFGLGPILWILLLFGGLSWFMTLFVIPSALDSFAGERERGTLEGLLVAPLSDRWLYRLKVLALVLPFGGLSGVIVLVMGLIAILSDPRATHTLGLLTLGLPLLLWLPVHLLLTTLQVGLGVCCSIRSQTRKGAQMLHGLFSLGFFTATAIMFAAALLLAVLTQRILVGHSWQPWLMIGAYLGLLTGLGGLCLLPLVLGRGWFDRESLLS